jgi:hypothetical protein
VAQPESVAKRPVGRPPKSHPLTSAPKPLVDAVAVTDFGGVEESSAFLHEAERDYTYVNGFSELKRQQDLAKVEVRDGLRKPKDVPILPVNLHWVRCAGSYEKTGSYKSKGYRAVTQADLDANHTWLTGLPPGAKMNAAGEIVAAAGDVVLMVADRETAARNALRKQQRAQAMTDAVGTEQEGFVRVGTTTGANPTITTE